MVTGVLRMKLKIAGPVILIILASIIALFIVYLGLSVSSVVQSSLSPFDHDVSDISVSHINEIEEDLAKFGVIIIEKSYRFSDAKLVNYNEFRVEANAVKTVYKYENSHWETGGVNPGYHIETTYYVYNDGYIKAEMLYIIEG